MCYLDKLVSFNKKSFKIVFLINDWKTNKDNIGPFIGIGSLLWICPCVPQPGLSRSKK